MNADIINLGIKIISLFFLAGASQIAFQKRIWWMGALASAIWISTFRTSILRAMLIYIGVFQKENPLFVQEGYELIRSGTVANVTDIIVLIAAVLLFIVIATSKDMRKKQK